MQQAESLGHLPFIFTARVHSDFQVRATAVRVVCEIAARDPSRISHPVMEGLCSRLRDTKPSVRREAAGGLLALFRQLAVRVTRGGLGDLIRSDLICCGSDTV